ncbi:hypothetical protein [Pseudoxanthomonas koreensis]|uniref:hypothetical protein n=1 Tax=Pseudoxanthomonas koreensis TaxID=266061 RepID=UPI001391D59E|nr:hypothetical protein [Pseudoxanthomonas koreensis]KAF1690753.1 hypothetical protein CSC64_11005 [Pseudoxanthomonas koreensis]
MARNWPGFTDGGLIIPLPESVFTTGPSQLSVDATILSRKQEFHVTALNRATGSAILELFGEDFVHGIDAVADREDDILANPRSVYTDADGNVQVEAVTVKGMGHAIAVDPGEGRAQCGRLGEYAADAGICAAYWISRFFGIAD